MQMDLLELIPLCLQVIFREFHTFNIHILYVFSWSTGTISVSYETSKEGFFPFSVFMWDLPRLTDDSLQSKQNQN